MTGAVGFVDRHNLWSAEQHEAAGRVAARVAADDIDVVRVVFADQHGILRGKTLMAGELAGVLADGSGIVSSLLFKDTSGRTSVPIFNKASSLGVTEAQGA